MISFKIYNSDFRDECIRYTRSALVGAEQREIDEVFDYLDGMAEEYEIGVTAFAGCLLVRIYDEEYLFAYPVAVTDGADEMGAVDELRRYAIKEEIPFVLTDVPRECAEELAEQYPLTELFAEDEESYTVRFISECADTELTDHSFEDGLSFVLPTEKYLSEYARLCRDEAVNKFWGYDFRCDAKDCDDEYFLREALSGNELGCTATFFVIKDENFIGESLLYYFDYLGGAECAVRLLPEYMGRGLGYATLNSLIEVAKEIGLKTLYATVDPENKPSVKLFEKRFERKGNKGENLGFSLKM